MSWRCMAWLGCIVGAGAIAGCARVRPWERGVLAHPCMTQQGRALEKRAQQHRLGAREAARGASGEVGAGCACN